MTFRLESLEKSGGTRKPAVAELRHALHFGRRWWRMGWGATISTGPPPPHLWFAADEERVDRRLSRRRPWEMGTTAGYNELWPKTSCGFRRVVSALSVGRRPGWGDCAPIAEEAAAAR
jgi:hypothetical protein